MNRSFLLLALLWILPLDAADLKFRSIYSDHMVLQTGMPIRIAGSAAPQSRSVTRADKNGNWCLEFPALPPGGPYSITVRGREKSITLSDVLIGEVWICAGQSNMEYPLWSSSKFWRSIGGDEAVRSADFPRIRFLSTPRKTSQTGEDSEIVPSAWKVCSPQSIADFSAVGFYFGRQLYRDLQVPVGLIGCYWSGSRIEPWISEEAFRSSGAVITGIDFRNKSMCGWKDFSLVVRGKYDTETGGDRVLLSDRHYENPFLRGFLSDICLRPSCYACRCKNGASRSDLTLGDYWGVQTLMPDFDDDKGVGLVLVNTGKGKAAWGGLDMEVRPAALEAAARFNGGFKEEVRPYPERGRFFRMAGAGKSVEAAVGECLSVSLCRRIEWKARSIAAYIVGKSRWDKRLWRMDNDIQGEG